MGNSDAETDSSAHGTFALLYDRRDLIPVFGSILAVMLLGEPAGWFHLAGFTLILAGVWLAGTEY